MTAIPIQRVSLFGDRVQAFEIQSQLDHAPNLGWSDGTIYLHKKPTIQCRASFLLLNAQAVVKYHQLVDGQSFTISSLGDTQICAFCGFTMKPLALVCHRCGARLIENIPNSRYLRVGKCIGTHLRYQQRASSFLELDFEFEFLDSPKNMYSASGVPFGGWSTTHVEDGWICAYCNSVNRTLEVDCQRCGGGRLPFSDLERMDKHCLYCGTSLRGNTICPACSDARSGYGVWMPRLDWN